MTNCDVVMKYGNRNAVIVFILIFMLVILGLLKLSLTANFMKFMGHSIGFPETIIGIPDEKAISDLNLVPIPKMVIWVDSTECSSCRIGNLYEYDELYRKSQDYGFEVVIMFSPREDEYSDVMHMVGLRHYEFPVYFDSNNSFGLSNKIPSDRRFHAFLLDCDNRVCFIGDPTSTAKLNSLFGEAMKGIVADR